MKFGSLRHPQKLDGEPVLVSRDNRFFLPIGHICPSVREVVERWSEVSPKLQALSDQLNSGDTPQARPMDESLFHSPLPRAFQWADGSAFIQHIKLVRKARNAPLPENLFSVPLMYQGGSDRFLAPREDIPFLEESFGVDFEAEVAVVTDFVPMQITPEEALKKIRLVMIVNDVSLRGLIPEELAMGFGFFQSKPSSSFAPFACTLDELGEAWRQGRLHLPLHSQFNGQFYGRPNAGDMHFHFGQLIAHAARTRDLGPGTIIGSGTVSNEDPTVGSSCLVEKRMIEKIETGESRTPFMKPGDTIEIEMKNADGLSLFGRISQKVAPYRRPN